MFATVLGYVVLSLMFVVATILCLIIVHIFGITKQHQNNPLIPTPAKRKKVMLLRLTIVGCICFEISIVLMVILLLELVLIDHNIPLPTLNELEYIIFILDAIGHITIIYAFSARFEWCFAGTLSPSYKRFVLLVRCVLFLLVLFCMVILGFMITKQSSSTFIFTLDMVVEMVLNILALSLFYVFVAHSYRLITMSFPKTNQFRDFIHHLADKYQLKKLATYTANTGKQLAMTIDGIPVLPIRGVKKKESQPDEEQKDVLEEAQSSWVVPGHSDPNDLVNVMSRKMLLATMVLICSALNMIVIISMELLRSDRERLRDAQTIWVCMLIVFDMLVTALMLYLQFTFNHELYWRLCRRLDLWWMKVVLKLVKCCWIRQHQHMHEEHEHRYHQFRAQDSERKQKSKKLAEKGDAMEIVVEKQVSMISVTAAEEERP